MQKDNGQGIDSFDGPELLVHILEIWPAVSRTRPAIDAVNFGFCSL
jgi:hypothetical protein